MEVTTDEMNRQFLRDRNKAISSMITLLGIFIALFIGMLIIFLVSILSIL